jgi:hypothetical protein
MTINAELHAFMLISLIIDLHPFKQRPSPRPTFSPSLSVSSRHRPAHITPKSTVTMKLLSLVLALLVVAAGGVAGSLMARGGHRRNCVGGRSGAAGAVWPLDLCICLFLSRCAGAQVRRQQSGLGAVTTIANLGCCNGGSPAAAWPRKMTH